MPYLYLGISIIFNIVGNHFFKFAGTAMKISVTNKDFLLFSFLGFLIYGIAAIFYIISLKDIPLSVAYPMLSITYIITIFTSYYFFKEPITATKLIGVALILCGLFFISRNFQT